MARITVEDCIDKFPSRFELVLVASNRARKLYSGEEPTVEKDNDKNTVIALREIAQETLSVDKLRNDLVEEYQTLTFADEEEESLLEDETDNEINQEEIMIENQDTNDSSEQLSNSEKLNEDKNEIGETKEDELNENNSQEI